MRLYRWPCRNTSPLQLADPRMLESAPVNRDLCICGSARPVFMAARGLGSVLIGRFDADTTTVAGDVHLPSPETKRQGRTALMPAA